MSLNDIKLSSALLSNLYPDQLIESESLSPIPDALSPTLRNEKVEPEFRSLGNNRQQILIIVNYDTSPFLPDSELALLTNMLGACKLSMDDVAIINLHHYNNIPGKDILVHFKSKRILMFGVEPSELDLPVNFPQFQVQNLVNASFLYSPSLDIIAADKLQKSKLWVCLQRLFNIS